MNEKQKQLYADGTYKAVMQEKKQLYNEGKLYNEQESTQYAKAIDYNAFTVANQNDVVECLKMRDNRKSRMRELRNRITYWQQWRDTTTEIYFVSFTFTDETLASTTTETRKRYIRKELKRFCLDYMGNIDFGSENGREHFHFIIVVQKGINPVSELKKLRKLGNFNVKRWKNTKKRTIAEALGATVNYTDKMSMHAVKTENNAPIITMRDSDYIKWRELGKELGKYPDLVNCFPESKKKGDEFAFMTDHPYWIKHNNLYGNLGYNFCFRSKEVGTNTMEQIDAMGELFGENFTVEYETCIVTGDGKITRKERE